jgi:Sec-independent protein translocase protein TatA
MKYLALLLIILVIGVSIFGCGPIQKVGNPIGAGIGDVSDELGGERQVGKGNDKLTIHPQGDKKIKMEF